MSRPNPSQDPDLRRRSKDQVLEAVGLRPQADEVIGGWWAYLPAVGVVSGLMVLLAFLLLVPGLGGLALGYVLMYATGFAFVAILNYRMVRRMGAHVEREGLLRQGMMGWARAAAGGSATGAAARGMAEMERLDAEARGRERLPSRLFAPMAALPLVGFGFEYYYLWHLNRLAPEHEGRWAAFLEAHRKASEALGMGAPGPASPRARARSFPTWAIGSLLLFPLLAYWYHVLIRETNAHFREQWAVEDQLLRALG